MPAKTKTNYSENSTGASTKDSFQTPRYATELIAKALPRSTKYVWEPAAGTGMMADVLEEAWPVLRTEVNGNYAYFDFLEGNDFPVSDWEGLAIVTNPPFSLKKQFAYRCLELGVPWALLIPADWSLWLIELLQLRNCQILIPNRRVDFITPNVVARVNDGEKTDYKKMRDIPTELLKKYSSSDFHSQWLTWGFDFPETLNFAELTNEMKKRIL